MAKKDTTKKAETPKETKPAESTKKVSAESKLKADSADYFKRFPQIDEIFATEKDGFFFKKHHAESASRGEKVFHFKKK